MSSLISAPEPIRSTLRSLGVLALGLGLTSGVLLLASSVVGTWN